jgi:hypothetical protein
MIPCMKIDNVEIPWSFIQRTRSKLGGSWDQTIDAFYKAFHSSKIKTIDIAERSKFVRAYVQKGFARLDGRTPYNCVFSGAWDRDKTAVMSWWNKNLAVKTKNEISTARQAAKDFFRQLPESI